MLAFSVTLDCMMIEGGMVTERFGCRLGICNIKLIKWSLPLFINSMVNDIQNSVKWNQVQSRAPVCSNGLDWSKVGPLYESPCSRQVNANHCFKLWCLFLCHNWDEYMLPVLVRAIWVWPGTALESVKNSSKKFRKIENSIKLILMWKLCYLSGFYYLKYIYV